MAGSRQNVEFVEVQSPQQIRVRVWERGVGETQACGTGMAASAVIASEDKGVRLPVQVLVHGGSATVRVDDSGYCRVPGHAEYQN